MNDAIVEQEIRNQHAIVEAMRDADRALDRTLGGDRTQLLLVTLTLAERFSQRARLMLEMERLKNFTYSHAEMT
jgi:hypothetical protein